MLYLPGTGVVNKIKGWVYSAYMGPFVFINHTSACDSSALTPFMQVEWNQVRHLVEDISCLFKGLDLRLMLCTKRILKTLDVSSCQEHLNPFFYDPFYSFQTYLMILAV